MFSQCNFKRYTNLELSMILYKVWLTERKKKAMYLLKYFMHINVYLHICLNATCMPSGHGGLELALHIVMSLHVDDWVCLQEQPVFLTSEISLQPTNYFLKVNGADYNGALWCSPIILALWRWRQGDQEFIVILSLNIISFRKL